jgi:endonuclease I
MKKLLFTAISALFAMGVFAQGPNNSKNYYKPADGKKGSALKTALGKIIYNRHEIGYKNLFKAYEYTDLRTDGTIWDMYSNVTKFGINDHTGNYSGEGDMYNREHSFPSSWFKDNLPMYCDIIHVVPTDGYINNMRSNYPFGEVDENNVTDKYPKFSRNKFSKLGYCKNEGYTGLVFEPNDEYKGDFARIYFYMATCYEEKLPDWRGNGNFNTMFTGDSYPAIKTWALNMLLSWAKNDPVSEKEILRNNAVYGHDAKGDTILTVQMQGNRNPFVDYPGLEEYIWGSKQDVAFSYDNYDGSSVTPVDPQPGDDTQTEQILLNETLLNRMLPSTFSIEGTPDIWKGDASYGAKASAYINSACTVSDAWLITPVIDLSDYTSATLSFEHAGNKFNSKNNLISACKVCVREEDSSTWTEITVNNWPAGTNWTYVESGDVDLSSYGGKKIQIGFHYTSTTSVAGTWEVKNLKVVGTNTATTIEYIMRPVKVDDRLYNLDGKLVPPSQRWSGGNRIFIKNGKKIIIN